MKNNKQINYSLELLRLLLSFWVVIIHCYRYAFIFEKGKFPVPTFMIISFYFYYNILKKKNIIKIKQRFQRILIPYIIWAIFLFIFNNALFILFRFSLYYKKLLLRDLEIQLIIGRKYHGIFYFQFILIFLTILMTIISFLFNKSSIFIFQALLIIAYIFQYSYLNLYIFKEYPEYIKHSLGNIFELFPFAVMGIILHHLEIIKKLKQFKCLTIIYIVFIIIFILKYNVFVRIKGFFYPGVLLNLGGNCIFILFSLLSFQNKKLLFLLKITTKFTGGIYYIHNECFNLLKRKFLFIKNKTIYGSTAIYIISYIICFLGDKLTCKTKFKFLFN